MRSIILSTLLTVIGSAALADDRALITAQTQEMADAIVSGEAAVWNNYLDESVIYAEEDDTYKGKAEMLKEIVPLPKGLGGTIKIELLSSTKTATWPLHCFGRTKPSSISVKPSMPSI